MVDRLTYNSTHQNIKSHMNITQKLLAIHTFDYIVFRADPGLTSCEDLATALPQLIIVRACTPNSSDTRNYI